MTTNKPVIRGSGWQLIALSSEVNHQQPLARRCLQEEYALFRDNDGNLCILEDRCAHRRAPLSLGRITAQGTIQCPYHGWSYEGQNGHCSAIPNLSDSEALPRYQVQRFMAREHQGFAYIWRGETSVWQGGTASTETAAPTDFTLNTDALAGEGSGLITLACQQVIDTLLDSPSLILKMKGVTLLDNLWLGEPCFDGQMFTVERAADWNKQARRRKPIASDPPLILRIQLDTLSAIACIELLDSNNALLIRALLGCQPVTPAVTRLLWRWCKPLVDESTLSKPALNGYQNLHFAAVQQVEPAALIAVKPYMSSIISGQIKQAPPCPTNITEVPLP